MVCLCPKGLVRRPPYHSPQYTCGLLSHIMKARARPHWAWAACVVLVVVAGVVNCEPLKKTPTIVTKYGQLRGFFRTVSGYGLRVATYLGVPYATPPVGANRFSPTRTLSQWVGVHEATHFGPACPQRLPDITNETAALTRLSRGRLQALRRYMPALRRQSEDCLYLNLYVPDEGEGGGAGACMNPSAASKGCTLMPKGRTVVPKGCTVVPTSCVSC